MTRLLNAEMGLVIYFSSFFRRVAKINFQEAHYLAAVLLSHSLKLRQFNAIKENVLYVLSSLFAIKNYMEQSEFLCILHHNVRITH